MLPGPSAPYLFFELLLLAAVAVLVGEAVRLLVAAVAPGWRNLEPVERGLLDFFLGGAAFYLVASLPFGLFGLPAILTAVALAAATILLRASRLGRTRVAGAWRAGWKAITELPVLLTLASALALMIFEVALAVPVGTGNSFDSSLLTLWTARLLQSHQVALSFAPYASVGVLTPQGTSVWLGAAQLLVGLPGARASLLVTPLFLAIAPLAGYVLGRRLFDSPRAGAAIALMLAFVASWPRVLVGGSNDFVLAFPLVLLVLAQVTPWLRELPTWGDAAAVGILLGYSAALNPVGAEWLAPSLLLAAALARPRWAAAGTRWLARWGAAVAVALVALVPSIFVLLEGLGSPRFVPGAGRVPASVAPGITEGQFVGAVDPYLFRPTDVLLSPLPFLRAELALLLTAGLGILVLLVRAPWSSYLARFRLMFGAAFVVLLGWLGILGLASTGWAPAVTLSYVTSYPELSIWLFLWYSLVAALPLVLLFEWLALEAAAPGVTAERAESGARARPRRTNLRREAMVPVVLALALLIPGVALTPVELPGPLSTLYTDFGNVTADDFALLTDLGHQLPAGARLLVAPGSAAEFVPAYASSVTLLYPMVPGWQDLNASYTTLLQQLTNDSLDAAGMSALQALHVAYIAVTGANTILWPPFQPGPMLAEPSEFPVLFHQGPDFLFAVEPG